jgi:hypothetical protein
MALMRQKMLSIRWLEECNKFGFATSVDIESDRPASWFVDSTSLYLAKNFVWRFCFFAHRWLLTSVKSMWFKTLISESMVWFKRSENQCQNLNWKIRSVRERKCSGNINSPSGYQYRIVTHKRECFGRIVEPFFSRWIDIYRTQVSDWTIVV